MRFPMKTTGMLLMLLIILILTTIYVVYTIRVLKYKKISRHIRSEKKALDKKTFPDLDDNDLKYRRENLALYQRVYLNSHSQRIIQLSVGLLFIVLFTIAVLALILSWYYILFPLISIIYFLFALSYHNQPSLDKQLGFWHDYLEKHPNNELKVNLIDSDSAYTLATAKDKMKNYFLFSGIFVLIFSIWAFIVTQTL